MPIPYAPDMSWNPITGCSPISGGCDHCWAAAMIKRHRDLPGYDHGNPFKVTFHPERLDQPRRWRKPKVVAVNFMSDWCHKDVPNEWRDKVWAVMRDCPQHTFITSTKRPERMAREVERLGYLGSEHGFQYNVWLGVTVEDVDMLMARWEPMKALPNLYINYEPALHPIEWSQYLAEMDNLSCLIVGAESGANARHFEAWWAELALQACRRYGVKFYMKQMDAKNGGANWDRWPESLAHLKVRELPWKLKDRLKG